jgi:hypothetical protein
MPTNWLTLPNRFQRPVVPESKRERGFHHDKPVAGLLIVKGVASIRFSLASGQVVENRDLPFIHLRQTWQQGTGRICGTDRPQLK